MEQAGAVDVAHQLPEGSLAPPPEALHGLPEAASQAQAEAEAVAAAAEAHAHCVPPDVHHGERFHAPLAPLHLQPPPGQESQLQPPPGGHQEPPLQADESLNELPEGADTKRCAACRIVKPVSEYYKDRTHSRGIKTRCKSCLRACKEAFKIQQRSKSAAEQVTVVSKKCSHCGQEKPAAEFSRSSYQRTGLRSWCKDCSSKSKKQAKAEGRWKSYDSKTKQPRKCRKCDELRQPDEFPIDPRNPTKRTRDCTYCLQSSVQGALPPGLAHAGDAASVAAMGAWAPHLGEYWHMDPARAQQLQGIANAEAYHNPPASESLMRILRAAMAGTGDEQRRMTPEMLAQLGVYTDPNDPFSDLPPDTQAAVLQQFVDQQQRQHNNQLLHAHAGFGAEMLYQREAAFAASQRPDAQLLQYAEQQQREAHEREHEEAAGHEDKEGSPQPPPAQAHHIGVGHFEQLRNTPYNTEGWQPPQHLQAHLQHHMVAGPTDWPSAFAPTHRHVAPDASPKRHSPDQE